MKHRAVSLLLAILLILQALPVSVVAAGEDGQDAVISNTETARSYYTVRFEVEQGEAPAALFFDAESESALGALPEAPAIDGKEFIGWYLPDGEEPVSESLAVLSDLTLTARYEAVGVESEPEPQEPVEATTPAASEFAYSDAGSYAQVAISGVYEKNQAPAAASLAMGEASGETVLDAWTVAGLKENTELTALLTVSALPELGQGESIAVYSLTGASLTEKLSANVKAGDSVSLALSYRGANGIALVKTSAPVEQDVSLAGDSVVWANENVSLTGKLPEGAVATAQAVTAAVEGMDVLGAYAISVYPDAGAQASGNSWQPASGKVRVRLYNAAFASEELNVYCMNEGEAELVGTVKAQEGWVTFDAEKLAVYAVAAKSAVSSLSYVGEGYRVSVAYDSGALIPDGAELSVGELDSEKLLDMMAETLGWTGEDEVFYTRYLNIAIRKDGEEIAAQGDVQVTVRLTDAGAGAQALQTVRFDEKGAQKVESAATAEGNVSFETSALGTFGFGSALKPLASWTIDAPQAVEPVLLRMTKSLMKKAAAPLNAVEIALMGFTSQLMPTYEETSVALEEGLQALGAYTLEVEGSQQLWVKVSLGGGLQLGKRENVSVYGVSAGELTGLLSGELSDGGALIPIGSADGFAVVRDTGYRRSNISVENVSLDGMLPKGASVTAQDVTAQYATFGGDESTTVVAYDISITSGEEEYQPDAEHPVQVEISGVEVAEGSQTALWHVHDDGTVEEIKEYTLSDGVLSFTAEGFSYYVLTETVLSATIRTNDGLTYEITVTYNSRSGIPMDDTELLVEPIRESDERYAAYVEASAESLGSAEASIDMQMARAFDISIVDAGDHSRVYEPIGDVSVSIRLLGEDLDTYENVDVLHFVPSEDESVDVRQMDSSVKGEAVAFTTDSFSVYVVAGYVIEKTITASDGNVYKVVVKYKKDAGIPEGADLIVKEITPADPNYAAYLNQTATELGANVNSMSYVKLFDISIVDSEENEIHIDPSNMVKVSVELLESEAELMGQMRVVHIEDEATASELAGAETENKTVTFGTNGFSVFTFTDFTVYSEEKEAQFIEGTLFENDYIVLEGKMPALGIVEATPVNAIVDGVEALVAYDIKIYANEAMKALGIAWQPTEGDIRVSLKSAALDVLAVDVYHIDGETTEMVSEALLIEDSTASFAASSFSTYAMLENIRTEFVDSYGLVYDVIVTYPAAAGIPEDARLVVTEHSPESDEYAKAWANFTEARLAADPDFDETAVGFTALDITIYDGQDNIVEPAVPVEVSFVMKELPTEDAGEAYLARTFEMLHISTKDGEELLETVAEAGTFTVEDGVASATFVVDSFSTFPLTWGVDQSATIHWGTYDTETDTFEDFTSEHMSVYLDTTQDTVPLTNTFDGYSFMGCGYQAPGADGPVDMVTTYLTKQDDGTWQLKIRNGIDENAVIETVTVANGSDIYVYYGNPVTRPATPDDLDDKTPKTEKNVQVNNDGTSTITLDVSAPVVTEEETKTANVVIVLDITTSMNFWIENEDERNPIYDDPTRMAVAKQAINTLIQTLDIDHTHVKLAYATFGREYGTSNNNVNTNWTDGTLAAANTLNTNTIQTQRLYPSNVHGTNWEAGMRVAIAELNKLPASDTNDTYVIFVTDGAPSASYRENGSNTVVQTGRTTAQHIRYAQDEVSSILNSTARHTELFSIFCGVSQEGYNNLQSLGGTRIIRGNNQAAMLDAFQDIASYVVGQLGSTNVVVDDGIPSLDSVSVQVSGDASGYTYKIGTTDENDQVTWADWEGAPAATYSNDNGVTWDLSSIGQLQQGAIYRLQFNVWPSQAAYDLIANLDNGTQKVASLTDKEREQLYVKIGSSTYEFDTASGNWVSGSSTLTSAQIDSQVASSASDVKFYVRTNTHLHTNYTYNGASYTETPDTLVFEQMEVEAATMSVHKDFTSEINPTSEHEEVDFYLMVDGKYYQNDGTTATTTDNAYLLRVSSSTNPAWTNQVYIAPGIMTSTGEVLSNGHDYSLKEIVVNEGEAETYEYEFTPMTVRPMNIGGELKYLIKKDIYYTNPSNGQEYTIEDYTGSNAVYYVAPADLEGKLIGTNRKKAELDVTKWIIDETNQMSDADLDKETFTFRVTLVAPIDADVSHVTANEYVARYNDSVTPPGSSNPRFMVFGYQSGDAQRGYAEDVERFDGKVFGGNTVTTSSQNRYLVFTPDEGGQTKSATIDISMKRNGILRFTNLPSQTHYTITEVYANKFQADLSRDADAAPHYDVPSNLEEQGYTVTSKSMYGSGGGATVSGTIDRLDQRYYNQFTNTIKDVVEAELKVTKHLQGYEWTGERYYFYLTAADGTPMPGINGRTSMYISNASGSDDKSYSFGNIRYTEAGTYTYTIYEQYAQDGTTTVEQTVGKVVRPGPVTVTVTVGSVNGKLTVTNITGSPENDTTTTEYTAAASVTARASANTTFTNALKTSAVKVKKLVNGTGGDKTKAFHFTATLYKINAAGDGPLLDASNNPVVYPYTITGSFTNGVYEGFTLTDQQEVEFSIPTGCVLKVEETDTDIEYYTTTASAATATDLDNTDRIVEIIVQDNGDTVTFTNHLDLVPPTGVRTMIAPFIWMLLMGSALMIPALRRTRRKGGGAD